MGFNLIFDLLEAVVDLFSLSSNDSSKQKAANYIDLAYLDSKGAVSGYDMAKDFLKHVKRRSVSERNMVIEYQSKWKWFANEEWRAYVTKQAMDTGLFTSAQFDSPCSLDSDWVFCAYKKPGVDISTASLDSRA